MKSLILGLGNPILGDDSIGWKVVEKVEALCHTQPTYRLSSPPNGNLLEFECYALGGISLMENIIGYDRVWLIDAIYTGRYPAGTVVYQRLEDFQDIPCSHLTSAHDMTLQTALELGKSLGADLPDEIHVIGIEVERNCTFSDNLSEPIRKAFPEVVQKVLSIIQQEVTHDIS